MSCPSQLYHIHKAVNKISWSTFFVIAFLISQKVQISSVNSFHGQISRIILRPWSPQSWLQWGESWFFRGGQNSSYYGLLLLQNKKKNSTDSHRKKSLTLTLLLGGDCRGDSHLDNQFKRKGKRLLSSNDLFIQNKRFVLPLKVVLRSKNHFYFFLGFRNVVY